MEFKEITAKDYTIYFENKTYLALETFFKTNSYSTVFILVDSNTKANCLPVFLSKFPLHLDYNVIEIPSGENHKNLETCSKVWRELTKLNADRKSILINIGGGMVTDLGGFVAATFKRGIQFINIPTSLLGMVDASVGGKTGVDFNNLKNQIGLFVNPELLIIDFSYLKTLPKLELQSGLAEVIKYALTYDTNLWKSIQENSSFNEKIIQKWIYRSIEIKNEIVLTDPIEQNLRKILNYGHTIGHAIETYFLENDNKENIRHGEAIAIGLIAESYISMQEFNFPKKELIALKKVITQLFKKVSFNEKDIESFHELMKHDKKNNNGIILFTLLNTIGNCKINCNVSKELINKSLDFYLK